MQYALVWRSENLQVLHKSMYSRACTRTLKSHILSVSLAHFDLISHSHKYFSHISTLLKGNSTVLAVRSAYNPPP